MKREPGSANGDANRDADGIDPTVYLLLKQMQGQHLAASEERTTQTSAFTGALDTLGGRFETKMDAQTSAMVSAARLGAGIVVLTLGILGSIAGAVTYFKGGGFEVNVGQPANVGVEPVASEPVNP